MTANTGNFLSDEELAAISPCHQELIEFTFDNGVQVGYCPRCTTKVTRINPRTGHYEWLDGVPSNVNEDNLRSVSDSSSPPSQ